MRNYLIIAGVPANDLEERAGYYGERVVLLAQQLGLRTCWVGIMFKRRFVRKMLASNEKLVLVVAIGYGETDEQDADGKPLVEAVSKGGAYAKLDLGIVRLHFEIGAGLDNFAWKN